MDHQWSCIKIEWVWFDDVISDEHVPGGHMYCYTLTNK